MSRKKNRSRFSASTTAQGQWNNFQYINAGMLKYDTYQRDLDMAEVDKIIREYNKNLVNPLKVSYRDGQYWVFDGQHTLEAHRKMKGSSDFQIACIVYHGLTYQEEAKLFALQRGAAKNVQTTYLVNALKEAEDTETLRFLLATEESGFEIEPGKKVKRDGCICAIKKALDCYKTLGDEDYRRMLKLLKETWHGQKWSISNYILAGMCILMKYFGDDLTEKRFIKKLSGVTESEIKQAASVYYSLSMPYRFALGIGSLYNKNGGKGTLPLIEISLKQAE